jgi:hypothetical protein
LFATPALPRIIAAELPAPNIISLISLEPPHMGLFSHLLYLGPWGLLLQAAAIIHFIRRRPDTYWLWIIIFLGWIGALVYLFAEAVPDLGLLNNSFKAFPRRKRIRLLETAILDNPSSGNYEELGDLYLDDGKLARAREAYDKAIAARSTTLDCFYRRGMCALLLGDAQAALPDLVKTVTQDPDHDFHRAAGLVATAYARTGQADQADAWFRRATDKSTLSETYLNYADFLVSQGRNAEAREWAQKVLAKKPTMPSYLRRRERPWFHRANKILRRAAA